MEYDIRQSNIAWAKWLCEGPCKSLGRHHKLTRVAFGWVPSSASADGLNLSSTDDDMNDYGDDSISEVLLDGAELCCASCPLSAQAEVDAEARKWGLEWACGGPGRFQK